MSLPSLMRMVIFSVWYLHPTTGHWVISQFQEKTFYSECNLDLMFLTENVIYKLFSKTTKSYNEKHSYQSIQETFQLFKIIHTAPPPQAFFKNMTRQKCSVVKLLGCYWYFVQPQKFCSTLVNWYNSQAEAHAAAPVLQWEIITMMKIINTKHSTTVGEFLTWGILIKPQFLKILSIIVNNCQGWGVNIDNKEE